MDHARARTGVAFGLGASLWWSCVVFYIKAIEHVSVAEILAHRIVWSAVLLTGFLLASGRLRAAALAVREVGTAATLTGTTFIIACNWFVFVWAVGHGRVLEISMGYYLYPLVSVALGFIFLRERFRPLQLAGILLACLAVAILGVNGGGIPVVSLALAFSFGFYGLLRKKVKVDGVAGLAAEMLILSPLALSYMVHLNSTDMLMFANYDRLTDTLLLASGLMTTVPLVLFVNGAKRLRYATIGLLQYTMPTMTFLIAVFVFGEPFDSVQLIAFAAIWAAVAIYCADTVRESLLTNGAQAISTETARDAYEYEEGSPPPALWNEGSIVRQRIERERRADGIVRGQWNARYRGGSLGEERTGGSPNHILKLTSCDFEASPPGFDAEANTHTEPRQHVDQRIRAE